MTAAAPVRLDLEVADETSLVLTVAGLLNNHPDVVDFQQMTEDLLIRQRDKPPLLGNGIALPHARTRGVAAPLLAIARTRDPIAIGPDNEPVTLVFLFVIPCHRAHESLEVSAMLARMLRNPTTIDQLLAAPDEAAFRTFLR